MTGNNPNPRGKYFVVDKETGKVVAKFRVKGTIFNDKLLMRKIKTGEYVIIKNEKA